MSSDFPSLDTNHFLPLPFTPRGTEPRSLFPFMRSGKLRQVSLIDSGQLGQRTESLALLGFTFELTAILLVNKHKLWAVLTC